MSAEAVFTAASNALFLACSAAMRRGSAWPVKMTSAVRGGSAAWMSERCELSVDSAASIDACEGSGEGRFSDPFCVTPARC